MCYPGSSVLVAVRTSDPGDRFIWLSFFKVWWYFLLCLAFSVSHPGSSALVTVWIGDQGDRFI